MSIKIHIDAESRLITMAPQGPVTAEVVTEAYQELIAYPDYAEGLNLLWDSTASTEPPDQDDVLLIVKHFRRRQLERNIKNRTAILVADAVHYGVSRMFQTLTDDVPIAVKVFKDGDAARAWLAEDSAP